MADKIKLRKLITKSEKELLIGKDAQTNEELVKKFRGKENIILHTSKPGSPFCIINDLSSTKEDIKEAAVVCAKYSQDWRDNKRSVVIHVFDGKNVFKRKGMAVGTFGVKKFREIKVKKKDIISFEKKK